MQKKRRYDAATIRIVCWLFILNESFIWFACLEMWYSDSLFDNVIMVLLVDVLFWRPVLTNWFYVLFLHCDFIDWKVIMDEVQLISNDTGLVACVHLGGSDPPPGTALDLVVRYNDVCPSWSIINNVPLSSSSSAALIKASGRPTATEAPVALR